MLPIAGLLLLGWENIIKLIQLDTPSITRVKSANHADTRQGDPGLWSRDLVLDSLDILGQQGKYPRNLQH